MAVSGRLPVGSLIVFGALSLTPTTTTRFLVPSYETQVAPVSAIRFPAPFSGRLRRLRVTHTTPAGNGGNIVYTVLVNGTPTALSVTLASTGSLATDLVNLVNVTANDELAVRVTKSAGIGTSPSGIIAEFEVF